MKDRKAHWERVYATKSAAELSWYQQRPTRSLMPYSIADYAI